MNVHKTRRENGDTVLRICLRRNGTHDMHGAYHVTNKGTFRVYYSDNQKRFPIMFPVMEI
jgi:hypothetical protein